MNCYTNYYIFWKLENSCANFTADIEYVFEFMQKFADERLFESNESLTTICFGDI